LYTIYIITLLKNYQGIIFIFIIHCFINIVSAIFCPFFLHQKFKVTHYPNQINIHERILIFVRLGNW